MKKVKRQAVVLKLVEALNENGSWCGETHIQKGFYFLQEMLNVPTGYDFILYKHGPFSFDLRDELSIMRANASLELIARPYPYRPSYVPGAAAATLMDVYKKTVEEYLNKIDFIAQQFSNRGVATLERLATALYITLGDGKHKDVMERAKLVNELKPHIDIELAIGSVKEVEELTEKAKSLGLIR
ncbi:MAG: hypothetical protein ACM3UW_02360 [Bacillota bacterium]